MQPHTAAGVATKLQKQPRMASYIVVSEVLLKWFSYVVKQHKQKNTFVFHLLDGKRSGPGETKNTIAVRQ